MRRRIPSDIDFAALAEFRYQIRAFIAFSERAARSVGIEPQQHQTLLVVYGWTHPGEITIGGLAQRLHLRHHSAVELVDRLESRGLVSRYRDAADRRQVRLRITRRGLGLLANLSRVHREELRSAAPRLLKALKAAIKRPARKTASVRRGNKKRVPKQRTRSRK